MLSLPDKRRPKVGFCPEVAIGPGVPRAPICLVQANNEVRAMDSDRQAQVFIAFLAISR